MRRMKRLLVGVAAMPMIAFGGCSQCQEIVDWILELLQGGSPSA